MNLMTVSHRLGWRSDRLVPASARTRRADQAREPRPRQRHRRATPERLGIVQGGGEGFEGKVDLIEELGSESYLYAHLDDPKVKGLDGGPVSLVARSAVRAPAKIGENIRLTRLDGAIHLFHPETGAHLTRLVRDFSGQDQCRQALPPRAGRYPSKNR